MTIYTIISIIVSGFVSFLIGYAVHRNNDSKKFLPSCTVDKSFDTKISLQNSIIQISAINLTHSSITLNKMKSGFLPLYFRNLKHSNTPSKKELFIAYNTPWKKKDKHKSCSKVYVTKSGTRGPTKCEAVVFVKDIHSSFTQLSHRIGVTQGQKENQYMKDILIRASYEDEKTLIPPVLENFDELLQQFRSKFGNGWVSKNKRKTVTVMVLNAGVMDIFLNLMCSVQGASIDTSTFAVFIGNKEYIPLIESFGAKAFYNQYLGIMPHKAADAYLDNTFKQMMWFKMVAAYIATACGYHVLFQDVDLVWLHDPIPYLLQQQADIVFMDDGARGTRYAPLFANSGFYFIKYNAKTKYLQELMLKNGAPEIGTFHSHQAVLSKHLLEAMFLIGLKIKILDLNLFPSGKVYHDDKPYIAKMLQHEVQPYVFHMCWTTNRHDKITYFRNINMWYLPEESTCLNPQEMLAVYTRRNITQSCCNTKLYWSNYRG